MSICLQKVKIDGHNVQLFQDETGGKITGYHFPTDTYYPDPLGEGQLPEDFSPVRMSKTKEQIEEELKEIAECSSMDVEERKLEKFALERFGVKVGVSERDGVTPTILYFPYRKNKKIVGYEAKLLSPKKFWGVGEKKDVDLFGWEEALDSGSKKLIITEGPLDAVSTYQMLKNKNRNTKWADIEPAVVSIPSGAGSAKNYLSKFSNDIRREFKEVVLVFDNDDAGKKAIEECVKILPEAMVASLPEKDPNACLMKGKPKAFCNALLFKSVKPKNTRIIKGSSLREEAKKKPEMGLSWPWEGLTELTRGIRRGETIYFGAGVKMGKSEVVNAVAEHLIVHHNLPVLMVKPEEAVAKTYQMLVGKAAGKIFHDPKIEFDEEAFDKAEALIGDKALIIDSYQFVDWDVLKGDIRYAVTNEGVKDIIIDPITCMTNQMTSSEANEFLTGMAAELSAMSKDLDFTSYIFCHLKAPSTGDPHEFGGKVMSSQFSGSRAMMRSCNYMIGLEGNKDPELPMEQRNMRKLVVLEDREFGNTGIINLYWDSKTGLFNEVKQ